MEENLLVISPPKIIMLPQSQEKSSVHSFFHDDESMTTQTNQETNDVISVKSTEDHESTTSNGIKQTQTGQIVKRTREFMRLLSVQPVPPRLPKLTKTKRQKQHQQDLQIQLRYIFMNNKRASRITRVKNKPCMM